MTESSDEEMLCNKVRIEDTEEVVMRNPNLDTIFARAAQRT